MAKLELLARSELKILEVLWERGDLPAGQLANVFKKKTGWNRNTTYTIIKKCVEKGFIQRTEPNFNCHILIGKEEIRRYAIQTLAELLYGGDRLALLTDLAKMV